MGMERRLYRNDGLPDLHDAVIVGYGPVGATAAALLAERGLTVAVVEMWPDIYDKPRAITFDHEVMRVFQACGIVERIRPFIAPHPGTHYRGVDGRVIKIFDPQPPPHPLGWPPSGTFVQPELEAALRDGVARHPNVDVLLSHRAVLLQQNADRVLLSVRDATRGTSLTLEARYVLGCDGANSLVRKALDITCEDLGFDEWWMVVDVRLHKPVDLPDRCIQYCWPERPATFVIGPGNLRRWEIKLLPGEDPDEFGRHDNVVKQLSRFVDPSAIDVWRAAVYRFHALLAERWRDRRVFLLGDACHQTPPFLGQGMCAGIRDAANLAWKLAAVAQSGAHERLLDTYEEERKPHVRALVSLAKEFGLIIGELDPIAAQARDEKLRGELERGEAQTIRQRYIPDLSAGVIDAHASAAAGTLFVQPRARGDGGDPVLLDDMLNDRFLLATATNEAQDWLAGEAREAWHRLGGECVVISSAGETARAMPGVCHVAELDGLFKAWAAQHGCAAVIVRPDRYVFGTANDAAGLNRLVLSLGWQIFG